MDKGRSSLILGIVSLGIIFIFGFIVIDWFLKLFAILKTFDAVIIVAIITGFVTILTALLKSIYDIKQTRLQYLTQKRETAYSQFVEMIYKINQLSKDEKSYSSEDQIADLIKFSKDITLWGSKSVVEKWMAFRKIAISDSNVDGQQLLKISEQLMNEMRKDLGVPKVKEKALLSFFINDIDNLD